MSFEEKIFSEIEKGLSGLGARMLSHDEFICFLDLVREGGLLLYSVETYRIEKNFDIPCIEHSLYGPHLADASKGMNWAQRCELALAEMAVILSNLPADQGSFGFRAWLEAGEC